MDDGKKENKGQKEKKILNGEDWKRHNDDEKKAKEKKRHNRKEKKRRERPNLFTNHVLFVYSSRLDVIRYQF